MIHPSTRVLSQNSGYGALGGITAPFALWTGEGVGMTDLDATEPQETLLVRLVNGVQLKCSPEQKFRTMYKRVKGNGSTMAKDLTNSHLVYLTDSTFEFDYLDLECYNYLNRISSEELGTLVGICQNVGMEMPDIPRIRKETYKELDRLLTKLRVPYIRESYYKRTDRFRYKIEDKEFLKELESFKGFPEKFWKSKLFLRGYLKAMFTFCQIGKEMFTLRAMKGSSFLQEIQQALLLFGINSSYSNGLKMSQLIVFKNNCYRLANNIGVFNPENLFQGVDFRRFLRYKDKTMSDMRYSRVHSVERVGFERLVELSASQIMTNGVILENYD